MISAQTRSAFVARESRFTLPDHALMMRAAFDFDRDVAERFQIMQPLLVVCRRQGRLREQRDDRSAMTWADLPDVQVGDAVLAGFQPRANGTFELPVGADIEQHAS